jgi:flavin-binding protein dodecin
MNDHVYSITEIVGTSKTSVEDAIQNGIKTASKSLRHLEWFEVTQVKGHIVDGLSLRPEMTSRRRRDGHLTL